MYVILAIEILVAIFIIWFVVREIRKIIKEKKDYFRVSAVILVFNKHESLVLTNKRITMTIIKKPMN